MVRQSRQTGQQHHTLTIHPHRHGLVALPPLRVPPSADQTGSGRLARRALRYLHQTLPQALQRRHHAKPARERRQPHDHRVGTALRRHHRRRLRRRRGQLRLHQVAHADIRLVRGVAQRGHDLPHCVRRLHAHQGGGDPRRGSSGQVHGVCQSIQQGRHDDHVSHGLGRVPARPLV